MRARRTFGPEIRIRIFWEQSLRLSAALIFSLDGDQSYGLVYAHLISAGVAAVLMLGLVARVYNARALTQPELEPRDVQAVMGFCLAVLPASFIRRLFSEFPVILLAGLIPGPAGSVAAAQYAVVRKFASVMQLAHLPFHYVMAPLASEAKSHNNLAELTRMLGFATRSSVLFAFPLTVLLTTVSPLLLSLFPVEATLAWSALILLVWGKAVESIFGPVTAVIEAAGQSYTLASFNAGVGVALMTGLSIVLIPQWGTLGAAGAASLGQLVQTLLAWLQTRSLLAIPPKLSAAQYAVSLLALLAAAGVMSLGLSPLVIAALGLLIAIGLLRLSLRYIALEDDADAYGRLTRWAKRPEREAGQSDTPD